MEKIIFTDGGLYFNYLSLAKQIQINNIQASCVIGDAISMISLPTLKDVLRRVEKNKNDKLFCFPDLLSLRVCGESLKTLSETHHNFHVCDNLFEIIAASKQQIDGEVVFFGVGLENAATTIAIGLIRAIMAGFENFKILGQFYYLPQLINCLPYQATQTFILIPFESLSTTSKDIFEKVCSSKNLIPVFVPNENNSLSRIIENIENKREPYTNISSPQIDQNQLNSFENLLWEVFKPIDWNKEVNISLELQPKEKYKEYFLKPIIQNDERNFPITCTKVLFNLDTPLNCQEFCKGNCRPDNPVSPMMISGKGICKIKHYFK